MNQNIDKLINAAKSLRTEVIDCFQNNSDYLMHTIIFNHFDALIQMAHELKNQEKILTTHVPVTEERTVPDNCNAKIVFRGYERSYPNPFHSFSSAIRFDLYLSSGSVHHCKFNIDTRFAGMDGRKASHFAGYIQSGEDQNYTYLHNDFPQLYDRHFKMWNPQSGEWERWGYDTLDRIISSVDNVDTGRLQARNKKDGTPLYEVPIKLTEEDCNLVYYCEIHKKDAHHFSKRNYGLYMQNSFNNYPPSEK